MYAIKNNDNHETCHHDFNFHSHDSYFVEFAPTTIDEKKFAYSMFGKHLGRGMGVCTRVFMKGLVMGSRFLLPFPCLVYDGN